MVASRSSYVKRARTEDSEADLQSPIRKRSAVIEGMKTSVSMEDEFWSALQEIAASEQMTMSGLISLVARAGKDRGNLSSALRLHALNYYRKRAGDPSA